MNRKCFVIAALSILSTACQNPKKDTNTSVESQKSETPFNLPDSLSTRRISFVLDLKQDVARNAWPEFGKKSTEGTMIYFNEDKSEVFFPDSLVFKSLIGYDMHSNDYLLAPRTDSIPFHMENMLSFDTADSSKFYYGNPVEQYCSVEEIAQYIPSVESTEMWSTMVIHEMFHHYQFNNETYKSFATNEISPLTFNPNDLFRLCKEDEHFLSMIQNENELLMKAISETNEASRDSLISTYLDNRKVRIERYSKENPNLEKVSLLEERGMVVSALDESNEYDIVHRCFYPKLGVPEDPVTGSAMTALIPYWADKLNKSSLEAFQCSQRGGKMSGVWQNN